MIFILSLSPNQLDAQLLQRCHSRQLNDSSLFWESDVQAPYYTCTTTVARFMNPALQRCSLGAQYKVSFKRLASIRQRIVTS